MWFVLHNAIKNCILKLNCNILLQKSVSVTLDNSLVLAVNNFTDNYRCGMNIVSICTTEEMIQ